MSAESLPSTPSPTAFFADAWEKSTRALADRGGSRVALSVSGRTVDYRGASKALDDAVLRGSSHLLQAVQTGKPDLELRTWEASSGHSPIIIPPQLSGVWRHGRLLPVCDSDHVVVVEPHRQTISMVEHSTGRAIYFVERADSLPIEERAAPMKVVWQAWGEPRGLQITHGAAVSKGEDALVLTAPGGNGKSTTALLALAAGWEYLSDDWCMLEAGGPKRVFSLYQTAKLHEDNLQRAAGFKDCIRNKPQMGVEKAVMELSERFGARMRSAAKVRALVVPSIGSTAETTFARTNGMHAFKAMVKVTVESITGSDQGTMLRLGKIANEAPAYTLSLGHDLTKIPGVLDALLNDALTK